MIEVWSGMLRGMAGLCALGLGLAAHTPEPRHAVAQLAGCDSLVRARPSDPLSYRARGDRCEGIYAQDVSGSSSLRILSLVESFEPIDDTSSIPLRIEWTVPAGEGVSLRARSVRPGLYYRMETARPIAASPYIWPTDVLQPLRIHRDDIGVIGSMSMVVNGSRTEVLAPLRIGRRLPPIRSTHYRLTVLPAVELSEVYMTIATTAPNGEPLLYVERDHPLGYGFYPAGRAIDVRLPRLPTRGIYLVRIAGRRKEGGSATSTVLLFHPGASPRQSDP